MLAEAFQIAQPSAHETDILDGVIFKLQVEGQLIPAQRIETFGSVIRSFQLMKIARLLVVIEDDCLVKLA